MSNHVNNDLYSCNNSPNTHNSLMPSSGFTTQEDAILYSDFVGYETHEKLLII